MSQNFSNLLFNRLIFQNIPPEKREPAEASGLKRRPAESTDKDLPPEERARLADEKAKEETGDKEIPPLDSFATLKEAEDFFSKNKIDPKQLSQSMFSQIENLLKSDNLLKKNFTITIPLPIDEINYKKFIEGLDKIEGTVTEKFAIFIIIGLIMDENYAIVRKNKELAEDLRKANKYTFTYKQGQIESSITGENIKTISVSKTLDREALDKMVIEIREVKKMLPRISRLFSLNKTPETETAEPEISTLDKENPSGELHKKRLEEIQKMSVENIEKDRNRLRNSDIEDVRYNARLLKPEDPKTKENDKTAAENLKEETRRRIAAYTVKRDNDWYELNYQNMGSNKGRSHELYVGLGDVLLDPDIKNVLIFSQEKGLIVAHRGVVPSGKHAGRIGFLNKNNNYVATLTGDKFRILDNSESDFRQPKMLADYSQALRTENESRLKHRHFFKVQEEVDMDPDIDERRYEGFKPTSDQQAINKLNNYREEKDGEKILAYGKKVCEKFGIPLSIMKELIGVETGYKWNPKAFNESSGATGLGQFLRGTWNGFIKYCNKNNIREAEWGNEPLTPESRNNPYIMLYATAWLMNETKKAFPGFEQKPFEEQAILYYLAHHEGVGGAKTFLRKIANGEIPIRPWVMDLSKRIAYLAATSDSIKLRKNRVFAVIDDGKDKHNGKGLIDLKGGQTTWVFGSSSALQPQFKGKPQIGRFGVIGDSPQSFFARLQAYWPEIEPLVKDESQKPKQVILLGLGANSPSNAMEGYMQIVNFLKDKGINNVKIGTVQELGPETVKLNEKIRELDNNIDFAKHTEGMISGVHFSPQGYDIIYDMIQKSASQLT